MTTATATKFLYTIISPYQEDLGGVNAFQTTYESDEFLTGEEILNKLIHEDDEVRWFIVGEDRPLAADGGWFVEVECDGDENECYELSIFRTENEVEYDPSSMTLEEVKAIYAELED